jgi:5,10-methenyltetrahydrofolate synthetase
MPQADHLSFSQKICEKLAALEWSHCRTVHIFEPIASLNEVNIAPFIAYLKDNYQDIHIYTSRRLNGKWSIVTYEQNTEVPMPSLDAVIVPMLGFDKHLQRIGYGGGYYDVFLHDQSQARKIGVCFEDGKIEKIPSESHDIAMDVIVSESNIYELVSGKAVVSRT